jgi:hypothetical protein
MSSITCMVSESNYNVCGVLNVVIKISMASHINI